MSVTDVWMPAHARFTWARFWGVCYWCGGEIGRGARIAYYPTEALTAHAACHLEACS